MPRACTICTHPDRAAIDAALRAGKNYRLLADRYGTSATTLFRHRASHLNEALNRVAEARQREAITAAGRPEPSPDSGVTGSLDVPQQLKLANSVAIRVVQDGREQGDGRLVLQALGVVIRTLELQLKATEQGQSMPAQGSPSGLLASPEWATLRGQLARALRGYPEVAARVAELLDEESA